MPYARSLGEAGAGARDPSSELGSSSSTYSSSICSLNSELGKGSKIFGSWIEKSTEGSGATTEGICGSSKKRFKTEEEDREARK